MTQSLKILSCVFGFCYNVMMPHLSDINLHVQDILDHIKAYHKDYNWNIQWMSSHSDYLGGWIMFCSLGEFHHQLNISEEILILQRGITFQADILFDCAKKAMDGIDSLVKQQLKAGNLVMKHKLVHNEDGTHAIESYKPPKALRFKKRLIKDNPFSFVDFS
jgi:hypothetical protein